MKGVLLVLLVALVAMLACGDATDIPGYMFYSYLRIGNSSAPPSGGSLQSLWRLENGALASPDKKFLSSSFTDLIAGNYYQLPDYLLAKTCDELGNHECMGFAVARNNSGGFLLGDQGSGPLRQRTCPKWFTTPGHFSRG